MMKLSSICSLLVTLSIISFCGNGNSLIKATLEVLDLESPASNDLILGVSMEMCRSRTPPKVKVIS